MPWSNIPPEHTAKAEKIYKRLRAKGMDKSKASAITYTTLQKMGKIKESYVQESIFGSLVGSLGKFKNVVKRGAQMVGGTQAGGKLKQFISTGYNNFKNSTIMKGVKDKVMGIKRNPGIADRIDKMKNSGIFGRFRN